MCLAACADVRAKTKEALSRFLCKQKASRLKYEIDGTKQKGNQSDTSGADLHSTISSIFQTETVSHVERMRHTSSLVPTVLTK